ncbi:MAG: HD domain-containing phosphohydrolase [Alphaproteobacteria bacterium]
MITDNDVDKILGLNLDLVLEQDENVVFKNVIETILDLCNCDAGYLFSIEDDYLSLKYLTIKSKKIEKKGLDAEAVYPLTFLPDVRKKALKTAAQIAAVNNEIVNIDNIELYPNIDVNPIRELDGALDYQTNSLLAVPIINREAEVVAVALFINTKDERGNYIQFTQRHINIIKSVLSNVALLLENKKTSKDYAQLLESFIEVLAKAIDYKSPYTGVHCQRVPIITRMLTSAVLEDDSPAFEGFSLSEKDWYALHIASWLHDCGKVTTPEYILDKSTKLETIYNRIHEIRNRFEILRRDAKIACLEKTQKNPELKDRFQMQYAREIDKLEEEFELVARCNTGDVDLTPEDLRKLEKISKKTFTRYFSRTKGLSWAELNNIVNKDAFNHSGIEQLIQNRADQKYGKFNLGELYNLSIMRGTINKEERDKINEHIVMTIDMLKSIPFPKELSNVVEYAGGHHEKVDGTGYPNGLKGNEMSIPTKVMAIADIFEALTSVDRPYKEPKKLSEVLSIMQKMKNSGHIDPDIYEVFIKSKVYLDYAKQYLAESQVDDFNDEEYL